jgi:hypothetical protein
MSLKTILENRLAKLTIEGIKDVAAADGFVLTQKKKGTFPKDFISEEKQMEETACGYRNFRR